ncbi:MAG: amidoligase family protein, partial [Oscillospiraceae bacterium]|nr:amidoligase family protein [Oscillospiraceae bacterium]
MTGLTRDRAAKTIAKYMGTHATHVGGTYDTYTVRDTQGRTWKIVSDSSIREEARGNREATTSYRVEVVSPICKYEDIPLVQEVVRQLRHNGAKVNSSCGIHIHVDASRHSPQTLRNIVNIMASKEDLLYKTLQVESWRELEYCKKADLRFLDEVNVQRPKTM